MNLMKKTPMIGWRGASRYYSDAYKEALDQNVAIKKVRNEMGLKNVVVMIPFAEQSKSCKSDGGYERIRFSKRRKKLELSSWQKFLLIF
jgi:phosphoenolpyruvate synthase/pyruvate phosphate dikinase